LSSDRMNRWLTLGANLGVLVGIVLILIELNQNADLMRAQMTQARGDSVVQTYRDLMVSDGWLEIRAKQRSAGSTKEWVESLSPTEYERVWYRVLVDYHDLRTQFFQYQSGFLDAHIWESSARAQARRLMQIIPYFNIRADDASDDFREFLNTVAQEAGLPILDKTKNE
jgi:hypothetical protein